MDLMEYLTIAGVLLAAGAHLIAIGIVYQRLRGQIEHLRADVERQENKLSNGLEIRLRNVEQNVARIQGRRDDTQ